MPYTLLGNQCCTETIACTSNQKFLPLYAPIYKQQFNYMRRYPGISTFEEPEYDTNARPEMIKTYYGKNLSDDAVHSESPPQPPQLKINNPAGVKSCSTC